MSSVSLRLPDDLAERLGHLAQVTGRFTTACDLS